MKIKTFVKALILIIIFFLCLVGFSTLTRVGNRDFRGTMAEATMPIVKVSYDDFSMGMLHGYKTQMDMGSFRGCIIPVSEDRIIDLTINTYENEIEKAEYRIRDLDQTSYVDNGILTPENADSTEVFMTSFRVANILEKGRQYSLEITLSYAGEDVYYYARIMESAGTDIDECVSFAWDFHKYSFDEEKFSELSVYIEPDGSDSHDLSLVTINSPLSQIGWNGRKPDVLGGEIMTLSEVTGYYNIINVDYVMMMTDDDGEISYYNVDEYYRVRYGSDVGRCYLLSYERSVNEIFDGTGEIWSEDGGINLGINGEDVTVISNSGEKVFCFSVQGDLWSFDLNSDMLTSVYSFRSFSGFDIRESYMGHEIVPLRVDEDGSIIFAVYGYMNRGTHEGEVGTDIFVFDALTGMNTEMMFIPDPEFEDALISDIGDVIYVNAKGIMYLHLHESIMKIDLKEKKYEVLSDTVDSMYLDFDSRAKKMVWQDTPGGELRYLDLERDRVTTFEKHTDEIVRMEGFLDVDYIYTVADPETPYMIDGTLPAVSLKIIGNSEGEVVKEYSKNKTYITGITISDYMVEVERATYVEGEYVRGESDSIVNEQGRDLISHEVEKKYDTSKQNIKIIIFSAGQNVGDIKKRSASEEILTSAPVAAIARDDKDYFYIYSKGSCKKKTLYVSEAINYAKKNTGIVVLKNESVWSRGKDNLRRPVDLETVEFTLRARVNYELSGVALSDALGFVSRDAIINAHAGNEDYLITGYDNSNLYIYDRNSIEAVKVSLKEYEELFGKSGNKFSVINVVK